MLTLTRLLDTNPELFYFQDGKPYELLPASGSGIYRVRVKALDGGYAEYEAHKDTGELSLLDNLGNVVCTTNFEATYLSGGNRLTYTKGKPVFSSQDLTTNIRRYSAVYTLRKGNGPSVGTLTIHTDLGFGGAAPTRKLTATVSANNASDSPQIKQIISGLPIATNNSNVTIDVDGDIQPKSLYDFDGLIVSAFGGEQFLTNTAEAATGSVTFTYSGAVNGVLTVDPTVSLSSASNEYTVESDKLKYVTRLGTIADLYAKVVSPQFTIGSRSTTDNCIDSRFNTGGGGANNHQSDTAGFDTTGLTLTTEINTSVLVRFQYNDPTYHASSNYDATTWHVTWAGKPYIIQIWKIVVSGGGTPANWAPVRFGGGTAPTWGTVIQTATSLSAQEMIYYGTDTGEASFGVVLGAHRSTATSTLDYAHSFGATDGTYLMGIRTASTSGLSVPTTMRHISLLWMSNSLSAANAQADNAKYRDNMITWPSTANSRLSFITGSAVNNDSGDTAITNGFDQQYLAIRGTASSNTLKVSVASLSTSAFPYTCFIIEGYTAATAPAVKVGSTVLDSQNSNASDTYTGTAYNSYVDTVNDIAYVCIFDDQAANTTETYEIKDSFQSGQNLSSTVTDSSSISDTTVKQPITTKVESVSLAEAIAKLPSTTKSESVSITDTVIKDVLKDLIESLSIATDSVDLVRFRFQEVTDSLNLSEVWDKLPDKLISESVSVADTLDKLIGLVSVELMGLTEAFTKAFGLNASESLNVSDLLSTIGSFVREHAESLTYSDTHLSFVSLEKLESIGVTDELINLITYVKAIAETLGLTETHYKDVLVTKEELVSLSEAVEWLLTFVREAAESVSISDQTTKAIDALKSEVITLTEALDHYWEAYRTIEETVNLVEQVEKLADRLVSESISLDEALETIWSIGRTFSETLVPSDTLIKNALIARLEALEATDTLERVMDYLLSNTDSLGATDAVTKGVEATRSESLSLSDLVQSVYDKTIETLMSLAESVTKHIQIDKSFNMGMSDSHTSLWTGFRTYLESVAITESWVAYFDRTIEEAISTVESLLKEASKSIPESLALSDVKEHLVDWVRSISDSVSIDYSLTKLISTSKDELITISDEFLSIAGLIVQDTLSIVETLIKDSTRDFSELVSGSDVVSKLFSTTKQESLTLSDAVLRGSAFVISSTFAFVDALVKDVQTSISDSLYSTDKLESLVSKLLTESVSIVDAIITDASSLFNKLIEETFAQVDSLVKDVSSSIATSMNINDSTDKTTGKSILELINFSSIVNKDIYKPIVEATSVVDTMVKSVSKVIDTSVAMTSSIVKTQIRSLVELLSLGDEASYLPTKVVGEFLGLVEYSNKFISKTANTSFSFVDNLIKSVDKSYQESVSLLDSFGRQIGRTLSDSLSYIDNLSKLPEKVAKESYVVVDSLNKDVSKLLTDVVNILELLFDVDRFDALVDVLELIDQVIVGYLKSATVSDNLPIDENITIQQLKLILYSAYERFGTFRAELRNAYYKASERVTAYRAFYRPKNASTVKSTIFRARKR